MKFINHIEPVTPRRAVGCVADVYAEVRHDFGRVVEPMVMFSPDERLLAAAWATVRESLMAGQVPRARKEAVAAAVAAGLRCPWCVDAHTTLLYATGASDTAAAIAADKELSADDPNAPLVAWAAGTGQLSRQEVPFGAAEEAEYIGTALAFHFIARVVLVLLDETFLPGGRRTQALLRRAGGLAFGRKARADRPSGLSTQRLTSRALPHELRWAASSLPLATAIAALDHHLETSAHLTEPSRQLVRRVVDSWRGDPMPLSSGWTTEHTAQLPADLRAATRLALLTSLAPHQVTGADVAAARPALATDAALVNALAWAAWAAARRIGNGITQPAIEQPNPNGQHHGTGWGG
ncbi:alkylhydroperoxidase AhpD family core domain protein [Mycobacterium basiliense]|uniref:Alkylhydroperoxidase AhpD family core domain protein n=1 Tax=Mycobacterium basiliense TaxID=2094119 RepID=A0A3S4DSV4_9MYCO|nr:carboxymuconolactone decarboxylase family protein [Mycobacterium basiliense]VDM88449.1 alkylhydroperoxidase AhpD family core domain protein [Mycobacterium basiliense]